MNVWRLMAHHVDSERAAKWTRGNDKIAIGWGDAGDLSQCASIEDISQKILQAWPEARNDGKGHASNQLWDFRQSLAVDDLVIVSTTKGRTMTTQITGDYIWSSEKDVPVHGYDYYHQRPVRLLPLNPDAVWRLAGGIAPGYSVRWTLVKCKNVVTQSGLRLLL